MLKRLTSQPQLKFRWEADHPAWNAMPKAQQSLCRGLVSYLLQAIVATDKTGRTERSESDEREDHRHAS